MKCELCHEGSVVADSDGHVYICKKCQDDFESEARRLALIAVLAVAVNGWIHNLNEPTTVLAATLLVSYVMHRYVPKGYRVLTRVAWLATLAALVWSDRIIPTSLAVSTLLTQLLWIARFP